VEDKVKLVTVRVNRKRWLRAKKQKEEIFSSYLYRPCDGKMCCLGFACRAVGMSVKDIHGQLRPGNVGDQLRATSLRGLVNPKTTDNDSRVAQRMMDLNDALPKGMTPTARERKLRELGKKAGIRFVFFN
jgi:hypothetical protein